MQTVQVKSIYTMISDNRRISEIVEANSYSTLQKAILFYLFTHLKMGLIVIKREKLIKDLSINDPNFNQQYEQLVDDGVITELEK
jgi:hypothetical protein